MLEKTKQVQFRNQQNPKAKFDILRLEDIIRRKDADHSPLDYHLVQFYALFLIEEGNGLHTIDFTDYKYRKGTVLTVRKDQIHKFQFNSSLKGVALIFTDEFLVSYLDELEALKSLQLFNELLSRPVIQLEAFELTEILNIAKRLQHEYFHVNDLYSQEIIRSELHILTTKLFRIKSRNNRSAFSRKYLSEFIQFQKLVESNVSKTLKVKDYAEMMFVSTKTLNNVTNEIVNCSAKEFIDDICVKQIKRLLINTQLSTKEIAYTIGFEETTNFHKYFKHRTGQTPEDFRTFF